MFSLLRELKSNTSMEMTTMTIMTVKSKVQFLMVSRIESTKSARTKELPRKS